jgi:hypothetical protein
VGADCRAVIAVLLIVSSAFGCHRSKDDEAKVQEASSDAPPSECRITFLPIGEHTVEWVTTDSQFIETHVIAPIKSARVESNPARYEIVGFLDVRLGDLRKTCTLFGPWGHFSEGDAYWIADFGELEAEVRHCMRAASRQSGWDFD